MGTCLAPPTYTVVTWVIMRDSPCHHLWSFMVVVVIMHRVVLVITWYCPTISLATYFTLLVIHVVTWVASDIIRGSHKVVMIHNSGHQSVFNLSLRCRQSVFTHGLQGRRNVITVGHRGHTKVMKGSHTSQEIS
jgi:hypothetical protein